jgi:CheY-like chemotaxis protein
MADTVLLIEDSATFRALLASMLATQGMATIAAETGKAGIQRATKDHPKIVILDLSLPDMTGVDVLSSLKANPETAAIPVIICTASVDGDLRNEVIKNGASEIFTKPVIPKDLTSALRRHLFQAQDAKNSLSRASYSETSRGFV